MDLQERTLDRQYILKAKGCGCRWCEKCCEALGLALMERLLPIIASFSGVLMMTLTVDPKLFADAEAAHEYVSEHQCLALWIKELRKRGYIPSGRYIWFIEFQRNGMPHWHFLIDSKFIPIGEARAIWDGFRPVAAGPVQGLRPGFGSVVFSATRKGSNVLSAAKYCMKYVSKMPEGGVPAWVLGKRCMRRFRASRGFWGCCLSRSVSDAWEDDDQERCSRTVGEIVESCGTSSIVVAVERSVSGADVVQSRYFYVGTVPLRLDAAAAMAGLVPDVSSRGYVLDKAAFALLSGGYGMRDLDCERPEVPVVVVPERFAAMRARIAETAAYVGEMRSAGAWSDLGDIEAEIEWRCGCFDDVPPENEVVRRSMRKQLVE